jgi:subtilase family serine protease
MKNALDRVWAGTSTPPRIGLAIAITAVGIAAFEGVVVHAQTYTGGLVARPLITQPIDEKKLVVLEGNTRPEAIDENDRGLVPDSMPLKHMQLVLQRPPELEAQLEKLIDDMGRLGSPVYHKWLTAEQFGARFGPAQQDIDLVTGWLQSCGFTVDGTLPSGMAISFSGNAGLVRQAFHTDIHYLQVEGETHFANMTDPKIPAALIPLVRGVNSLHNFMPHNMMRPRAEFTFDDSGTTKYLIAPPDLATIYNLNPAFTAGYTGTGQTVAVVEDTDILNASDFTTFRSEFGLSGYTSGSFTQVHPTGAIPCSDPGENGDEGEAALDAEWASAAAPNAAIVLASCTGATNPGEFLAVENLVNETTPPKIISMSYGECEANMGATQTQAFVDTFQQAASEGISVFVSAGDQGGAACDRNAEYAVNGLAVNGHASTPYNVAVGGTDFSDSYTADEGGAPLSTYWSSSNTAALGSALSYIPEIPWNSSCASRLLDTYEGYTQSYGATGYCNTTSGLTHLKALAGSGGSSIVSTQPNWQGAFGVPTAPPTSGTSTNPRYLPDVSLFAATGLWDHFYVYCMSDTTNGGAPCSTTVVADVTKTSGGGTSYAAPIMAGIQALINQEQAGAQGNPNPIFYALATTEYGSAGSSVCNSSLGTGTSSACIFYDVTLGDNDIPCFSTLNCIGEDTATTTYGALSLSDSTFEDAYPTTTGWDFATGLGTINVYNLIQNWNGVLTGTGVAGTNPVAANTNVTFTATVTSAVGQGLTGNVTWSANTGCAPSALSSGQATCTTNALPTGSPTVTATYAGTAFADASPYFHGSFGSQVETVNAATDPTITWNPPTTIINGTTLASELNAMANAGGIFSYTATPSGGSPADVSGSTILTADVYTLTANFAPTDGNGYGPGSKSITLTVSGESVWIVDGAGGTSELAGNGYGITSSTYSGADKAIAIDSAGNVWTAGTGSTLLKATSQIGTQPLTPTGGGIDLPVGIAIDGSSKVWITNGNSTVSEFSNAGTALSPPSGFSDTSLSTPTGIAIDLGGSVWIANKGNNSVTRILGVGASAAPLSTAAANKTTGAKP